MTTVNNNVGLDNSWTAELVRSIDKRTTEGGFGNYVMGMSESALVVVAALVDAVKHAVFMAPYSLLTLDISKSFWHGTRAVEHVLQAPLALPGVLVPQITVATASMLQITSRWEAQPAPANWKEKTITFAKNGLEKISNIPHAVLGLKIAGGAAVVGGAGYGIHSFGLLNPVYNLFGFGGVQPEEQGLISWLLSNDIGYVGGTAAATGLIYAGKVAINRLTNPKSFYRDLQVQDGTAQKSVKGNMVEVATYRWKNWKEFGKGIGNRVALPALATVVALGARYMGYIDGLTTASIATIAAARVVRVVR